MNEFRAVLDDEIGEPPRSTVDVESVIAGQRRRSALRLVGGAATAGAVAVAVVLAGSTVWPRPGGGLPAAAPAPACGSLSAGPTPDPSPWIPPTATPTGDPAPADPTLPIGAEARLTAALSAAVGNEIDPSVVPAAPGLEVLPFVPDLYRHLAASDLAIVQGGLSTTMELTACRRPFLYVPLRNHFEQTVHVRHRLDRHRAGRCLSWDDTTPDALAAAIAAEIGREVDYVPVDPTAATRAAALLAELI